MTEPRWLRPEEVTEYGWYFREENVRNLDMAYPVKVSKRSFPSGTPGVDVVEYTVEYPWRLDVGLRDLRKFPEAMFYGPIPGPPERPK